MIRVIITAIAVVNFLSLMLMSAVAPDAERSWFHHGHEKLATLSDIHRGVFNTLASHAHPQILWTLVVLMLGVVGAIWFIPMRDMLRRPS